VWENLEATALAAPATAIAAGWVLLQYATGSLSSASAQADIAFDVFAIGSGEDFDRP
jgi:hypothetical protein